MKIFGTDGIRGEAGIDITPFTAMRAGLAIGIYLKRNTNRILIGKDTRRSGYMIENSLVSALTSLGYDVIQIGPMPTPAVAFLTEDMRCDAGIMISASHNPYYDNGIKFFNHNGYKFDKKEEKEIETIYNNLDILKSHFKNKTDIGSSKRIDDVIGRYIVHIKNSFPKNLNLKNIKIVVDTANGASYKVAPIIFSELGAEVITINDKPNGYNINENCGAIHPESLCKKVKEVGADIGFALDGDADRLVVVDNSGNIVNGDKLLGALSLYLKNQGKLQNNGVVATIMSNIALEEFLDSNDIKLIRSNVGDKFVLEEMINHSYNFGGEQSGHIIFSNYAKTGDGILSALQTLALMLDSKQSSIQILNPFLLHPQLQKNIDIKQKKPLENMKEKYISLIPNNIRHIIRYSGTENKLRILLEGKDKDILDSTMKILIDFFNKEIN
ncbi:phosphoglucosamine mutase [Helicobacter sp. MIT 99-5507]|uniref:phosphoglucosamine mutase n=1 Tax=Helicobacter sp. MIT 99-5507 TaxID=152489 RepID=UPI000E1F92CE|nr:phosphoglucosamine mutase [Helicobacter sp. MIT 99-5507]RDU58466.1 phosphoglucosamine mutase [Helicobacter sp. MIT 99-5507]